MERASSTLACSASQARKNNKPLVEKRRRERINGCLSELKSLLVDSKKDATNYSKLEKADILEITVRHLRRLQKHQSNASPSSQDVQIKYRAGFSQCAQEVTRFLNSDPAVETTVKSRLLHHLSNVIQTSPTAVTSPPKQEVKPVQQPLCVQIPSPPQATQVNVLPGIPAQTLLMPITNIAGQGNSQPTVQSPSGYVQLIPSRLPNGTVAYVMSTATSPVVFSASPVLSVNPAPQAPVVMKTSPVVSAGDSYFASCVAQTELNYCLQKQLTPTENVWRPW